MATCRPYQTTPALLALLALLALPLSSCRIVNGKPDMGGVADIFTPAQDDTVYIESKPTGSTAVRSPLPSAPTAIPQPVEERPAAARPLATARPSTAAAAPGGRYTVKAGDTLSRIARVHGVGTASLAAANGLDMQSAIIRPGQQLAIPQAGTAAARPLAAAPRPAAPKPAATAAPAPAKPAPTPVAAKPAPKPAPAAKAGQHILRQGETLAAVSRQYGVSLQELMRLNSITAESARSLRPGTPLTLPTKK